MAPTFNSSRLSDFVLGKLSPEESLRVLDELERDPEASQAVDDYAALLVYAQGEGREVFERRVAHPASARVAPLKRIGDAVRSRRWVLAAAAVVAIAVVTGMFVRGKSVLWGDEAAYAALTDVEFGVGIRAEADDNLMVAMTLFREGNYDRSIRVLERVLKAEPSHPFTDFVNYSLGVVHLAAAESRVGGSISLYDREHVNRALESLRRAAMLTPSSRLAEEAHWLTAKGQLMLGEREAGLSSLERVIEYEGKREGEARRLKILIESQQ
jgi:tetratricopeptide (TPR) repeat protein